MGICVILVATLFVVVKSDIGIGYQYRAPATSYEVPFRSIGNLNDRQYYHIDKPHFPTGNLELISQYGHLVPSTPSSLVQTPIGFDNSLTGNLVSSTPSSLIQTPIGLDGSLHGKIVSSTPAFEQIDERYSFNTGGNIVSSTPSPLLQNTIDGRGAFVDNQNLHFNSFVSTTPASILQTPVREAGIFANVRGVQNNQKIDLGTRANIGGVSFSHSSQDTFSHETHSQETEVQKHLYFFSAPDEPEEIRPRVLAPSVAPKKNVKLIFIKAPTYKFGPVQIPAQVQNEEKTLVYVLVKKPDEPEPIVLPTSGSVKPSKPEVFFIKYKTQKEAQDAVSNIQAGGVGLNNGASLQTISSVQSDGGSLFDSRSNLASRISETSSGGLEAHSGLINTQNNGNLVSRISSTSTSGLPSVGDFSHLNSDNEHVYGGIRTSNVEYTPTLAPETHEEFSTIKTLLAGHDQVQGYSSTTPVNAVTYPTITSKNAEVKPHSEYGPPK